MKAYLVISVLASALTWFLSKSDADLSFGAVFVLCLIMPIIADSCGVMKKEKTDSHL
jgi:hypothetical protein